jgi:hypothetical protein
MTALSPGTTLAALHAFDHQQTFTRKQVAYIIRLSYNLGLAHGHAYDIAELLATWAEQDRPPTRDERIAAEVAAPGPPRYPGGNVPVDWDTGKPVTG